MSVFRQIEYHATIVLVGGMVILVLLGFARIYTVTQALKQEEARACQLRLAGRANTNTHERVPLAAAFNYLGDIVAAAAAKQKDPVQKAASQAFAARFKAYARLIQPLPNPNC